MRLRWTVAAALVGALALTSCGGDIPSTPQASQAPLTASMSARVMSLRFCISSHTARLVMMSGILWMLKLRLPSESTWLAM